LDRTPSEFYFCAAVLWVRDAYTQSQHENSEMARALRIIRYDRNINPATTTPWKRMQQLKHLALHYADAARVDVVAWVQGSRREMHTPDGILGVDDVGRGCTVLLDMFDTALAEMLPGVETGDVSLVRFRDDHSTIGPGDSWLHDTRNATLVNAFHSRAHAFLHRHIGDRPAALLPGAFEDVASNESLVWARGFLESGQRLLHMLWTLVHMTYGQPARSTEMRALLLRNGGNGTQRNLLLLGEQLLIVVAYNKSQSTTGRNNMVARFLPPSVSLRLARYLLFVREIER
jgi:hypothetical protein